MKELEEMKKSFDRFMAKAEQTLQRMKRTEQILDKEEKKYLENVIRPFRYRVIYISKISTSTSEYIRIGINNDECMLPYFKAGTMYKGMKPDKEYTLKELGLFERK